MSRAQQRNFSNRRYLDAVADHVVLFDGAMGTSIQTRAPTAADYGGEQYLGCVDYLSITRPDMIEAIHDSFLAVGCEVVETNTFRGNRLTLGEYSLGEHTLEINRAAARIARRACDRHADRSGLPRFVAGSMGPSGKLPGSDDPDLSDISREALVALYCEQSRGLCEGGADLLLLETSQDMLEVKAAIQGVQAYFAAADRRIPLQVQVTLDTSGRMLLGTDIDSALTTLEALPVDVIGLNCSTGPEYMRAPVQHLLEHSRLPLSVLPNAGLPVNVEGEAIYPMEPGPFSEMVADFAARGVNVVGGCCGTTPEHLAQLAARVHGTLRDGRPLQLRPPLKRRPLREAKASSAMSATPMVQQPGPTMIGERVSSLGSRAVKQLLLADDYEGVAQIAVQQVERGAHMLDVCVALTERDDEAEQMQRLVKMLAQTVPAPLIIDTTEADVAAAALEQYPGRAIINGNNLENGRERIDRILPIALEHGAAVLSMTIDEEGMAHGRAQKLAVAQRIAQIACDEYGLRAEDLIFDTLTFPLTTGQAELRDSALETIEGLRLIKQRLPGTLTALGISNVSFGVGMAARGVLNSVFLWHAVQAGLDMAIVNPAHITPLAEIPQEQRALAEDLIFNRDEDALARYIQFFEQNEVRPAGQEVEDPTADMSSEEALHWHIVHRRKDGLEALIDDCLLRQDAVGVLNKVLLPAMKEVGDKFGAGELILPFVLQSAEAMKRAVAWLEQYMERLDDAGKGTVLLATVYGDVHDIGKNLVKTILGNNGYTVHDLGKQVPANTIIDQAQALGADAIGLSALLVSTSKQMPLIVNELARRGLAFPVLIGGAAINRRFGHRILFLEDDDQPYAPGVFYCRDAFEGLAVMDDLVDPARRAELVAQRIADARAGRARPAAGRAQPGPARAGNVPPAPHIPQPPFFGAKTIESLPLEIVLRHIHRPELFRLSWGAKNTRGEEWTQLEADFTARLETMSRQALRRRSLRPQAVYGYFPANSAGDDLILWEPETLETGRRSELARFHFPRQPRGERLCLADYFAPADGDQVDTIALQVVTVGAVATETVDALQAADEYSEAWFFHGLAVQAAEATAVCVHRHIARELGIPPQQGKRYSWGYPACPELADHETLLRLLPDAQALGLQLTSAFQWVPEQSTAALIVHHPAARYFSVGRLDRAAMILEGK